jgi:hypothetical protein
MNSGSAKHTVKGSKHNSFGDTLCADLQPTGTYYSSGYYYWWYFAIPTTERHAP